MITQAKLTAADIVLAVRMVAAEAPEGWAYCRRGTYGPCRYAPDELNPEGCLVGAALRRCGVTLRPEWDGPPESVGYSLGVPDDEESFRWLREVQYRQDRGEPWRMAVASADRCHPNAPQ